MPGPVPGLVPRRTGTVPGPVPGAGRRGPVPRLPPRGRCRQCPLGSAPPRRGAASRARCSRARCSPARCSPARCSRDAGPGGGPGDRAAAPPLPLQPPRGLPARVRAPTPQVTPAAPAGPPPAALAPQDEDADPLLPRPGVRGRRLRALRPALLPRLPAALLPCGTALGRPRVRCARRAQLPGVQPRPRRAAAAASAVPPLRRRLQLGADAGLAPGAGHRRAGVRAAHEPRAHRRLRGGRGDAEHRPRGVAHQRPAAAEEPALLLPAVPGDRLRHLGAPQEDEPGEGGLHLPGAAEGDGDVPAPADLHPDRGEDGLLRRRLPERDGEEQGEVGLFPEHGLVHHDPGHGAVRAHPRLRHGQRQLLQGEEPHERALPLLREGPAGRVQDVPGARAGPPRRAPLHHRESHLLPLGQEEGHRLHPPVVGGWVGAAARRHGCLSPAGAAVGSLSLYPQVWWVCGWRQGDPHPVPARGGRGWTH